MIKQVFKTLVAFLAVATMTIGPAWGQISKVSWVLTPYGDLQTGDTVVIVDKTSARALPNTNSSSGAPSAVEIDLSGDQNALTEVPAATLQWVVVLDNGYYLFRKPGTDDENLYCFNTDNGVHVGTIANNKFSFENGGANEVPFLKNTNYNRYLGVYNNQNWRCYQTTSSNISNTVIAFYKKTVIIIPTYTARFASGNDGWSVMDVTASASATAPAILQNVMAGDSLVVTAPPSLPGKVKSVKAVKYVPPVLVQSIVLDKQTASLGVNSTMTLSVASVLPENAADKSYTWSSDDITKATVNQNGVVTGHNAGTANIIATANDGSGVKDTCVVTVLSPVILDGVTVLYASDNDTWETVMGYNPGVMYQDGDKVRLTSNDAILFNVGHPIFVGEFFYPFAYDHYQWMRVIEITGSQFYYHQGETWQEAINADRMYNEMWSIEGGQVKYHGVETLVDSNYEPVNPTATIDPSTVNYDFISDN